MSAPAMLRSKQFRVEDVFENAKRDARIRLHREQERQRELERLQHEQAKPAVEPIVTVTGRHVLPWALPLQKPARYKGASGGRAPGKSHFYAEEAVERMVVNPSLRVACIREVQRSLDLSVKALVESKIREMNVSQYFDITNRLIRRVDGDGLMIFEGMQDHTADSIKSLEGFGIAWFEEAQRMSKRSKDLLLPTIRLPGSEIWFSWNPESPEDAVDAFFAELQLQLERGEITAEEFVRVHVTYLDNPLCPEVIIREAERTRKSDPDAYEHIWLGGYDLGGHGRVYSNFKNKPYPEGNIDESIEDAGGELLVGMDFNVNPMTAVIAQRAVDECEVLDAIEIMTSNTQEMADEINTRYPDRHIVVCPDPSGKRRQSSAPVGQTDFTILERAGFEIRAPSAAPLNVDSINNVNQMLLSDGVRRVRISPAAKALIGALGSLVYKEGTSQPDKNSRFIHVTDAFKYLIWEEFQVAVEAPQWGSSSSRLY